MAAEKIRELDGQTCYGSKYQAEHQLWQKDHHPIGGQHPWEKTTSIAVCRYEARHKQIKVIMIYLS